MYNSDFAVAYVYGIINKESCYMRTHKKLVKEKDNAINPR